MVLPGGGKFLHARWAPRRVDAAEARVATAVARWLRPRTAGAGAATLAGGPIEVRVVRVGAVALDPDGAVAVIRGAVEPVLAIGGGTLVRALAQATLGGPDELGAARPPTTAEQAVWALAVSVVVNATTDAAFSVEPSRIAPAMIGGAGAAAIIELAVDGVARGPAWIAVPAAVLDRPGPITALAELAVQRAAWLEAVDVTAHVVTAHAAVTTAEVAALRVRDVIVVGAVGDAGAGEGSLRVGAGAVAVTIAADRVTVRGPYRRGRMDESLGDDVTVELAVAAGTVSLSARAVLELAPGQVLALGRPAAGQVELVLGRQVIGTGELIDVDGELAVRVL